MDKDKPKYSAIFVSDIHLFCGYKDKEREDSFLRFLDDISLKTDNIYILGDLFDFYYEYSKVILKESFKVFDKLYQISSKGKQVFFMGGNHDYWTGEFLSSIGIEVIPSPYATKIDEHSVYLHHGDGIPKWDWKYRLMRKIIRSPFAIKSFSIIHPNIARSIVKIFSVTSRRAISGKMRPSESYLEFAQKLLRMGYDIVIMGHTHIPEIERLDGGIYINTGDWVKNFTYSVIENGEAKLFKWVE